MKYTFQQDQTIQILTVDNLMLDYENSLLLKEVEILISEDSKYFLINLEKLDFINSVGLSFLIAVLTKSRNAGGETVITNVSAKITQLLAITKLKSIFTVCENNVQGLTILKSQIPTSSPE